MYLPPEASHVIVAADVDIVRDFDRSWEFAALALREPMSMASIARAEGGYPDTINDVPAAWIPSDAYFLQIESQVLGMLHPSNRQAIARWVDSNRPAPGPPVGYLARAATRVEGAPQIVLALDTRGAAQPHRLNESLSKNPVVQQHDLNLGSMIDLLMGMKGLILEVTISDKVEGALQLDFGETVSISPSAAKDLLRNALSGFQVELPGIENWTTDVRSQSIRFSGALEDAALRRILSLLEIPSTKFSSLRDVNTDESSANLTVKASRQYYSSIAVLIDDLEDHSSKLRGDAYWMDRYALKIERLPILHVDAELLEFGSKTVETLRLMSTSRKSSSLRAGVRASNIGANTATTGVYSNYEYRYNGSGYNDATSAARYNSRQTQVEKGNARTQEAAVGTSTKIEGFRLIRSAQGDIRQVMTERYGVEF